MSCYFRVLRKWDAESSGLSNALDLIDSVKSFGFNSSKLPLDSAFPPNAICHAYCLIKWYFFSDAESSGLSRPDLIEDKNYHLSKHGKWHRTVMQNQVVIWMN